MSEVTAFIQDFFHSEEKAIFLRRFPNLEEYYRKLDQMNSFALSTLEGKFGLRKISEGYYDEEEYQEMAEMPPPIPRHLFKISHYKQAKYGDLWACYVSNSNPGRFSYFNTLFVAKVEGELKIVGKGSWGGESDYDRGVKNWHSGPGHDDDDINIHQLGTPITIERYVDPKDCEFSMKDYLADV